jgi:hypothetical protein
MNEPTDSPTARELRHLVSDSSITAIESSSLRSLIRQQYVFHSARHARNVDGISVLPKSLKTYVAGLIWFDATGESEAPPAAGRTPTLRSIGVYLSRLGRIATDPGRGLLAISSDAEFADAERGAHESAPGSRRALLASAFADFQVKLTNEERQALAILEHLQD